MEDQERFFAMASGRIPADLRIDNRIMFTAGKAAASLGLLGDKKLIFGIPLSVSGKSPYFDRKFNR